MSEELTKTKLLPIQGKDMDSIMQNRKQESQNYLPVNGIRNI